MFPKENKLEIGSNKQTVNRIPSKQNTDSLLPALFLLSRPYTVQAAAGSNKVDLNSNQDQQIGIPRMADNAQNIDSQILGTYARNVHFRGYRNKHSPF